MAPMFITSLEDLRCCPVWDFSRSHNSALLPLPDPEHIFTDLHEGERGAHMTWVQILIQAQKAGQSRANHHGAVYRVGGDRDGVAYLQSQGKCFARTLFNITFSSGHGFASQRTWF